jgi:hypothetical protein
MAVINALSAIGWRVRSSIAVQGAGLLDHAGEVRDRPPVVPDRRHAAGQRTVRKRMAHQTVGVGLVQRADLPEGAEIVAKTTGLATGPLSGNQKNHESKGT